MRIFGWIVFALFAIVIGVYPAVYALPGMSDQGLLASKPPALLADSLWRIAFYVHISFGGLALLCGWTQFSKKLRSRYVAIHRMLGKTYVIAVALSGLAGFHIALFATGGVISMLGFAGLAIAWLFTTMMAFQFIRKKDFDHHELWMIRSYALTFAAVTLRIWLPLFQVILGLEFLTAYRIIAWFCWVPNLIVAELIVNKIKKKTAPIAS